MVKEDDPSRVTRENDRLAAENERLHRELRDATEKYSAIRDSLSWRITAPLRKAMDLLVKPKQASGPLLLNDENYRRWADHFDKLTGADRTAIRNATAGLKRRPLLSLLVVIHDEPAPLILQTIQSIRKQLYREWEICLVDDASIAPHVARAVASCGDGPNVRVNRRISAGGFSVAAADAIAMAQGEFVAFLDPGDVLVESALFEIAAEIDLYPDAAIVYSDEDELDDRGQRCRPRFKTDWNPDLLLEQDYLGRLCFYQRQVAAGVGAPFAEHDLALKAAPVTPPCSIRHLPSVLCHGVPKDRKHIRRRRTESPTPKVSILIPTRDRPELLERCIDGVLNRTDYPGLEVIVIDNDSREERTREILSKYPVRILSHSGEFNWAAMNNAGAKAATGEVLLFLNNDTDVIDGGWLRELAAHAVRPEVGAAGAKLLFADGTVQHAGIWLGPGGRVRHFLRLSDRGDEGYLGQLSTTRDLSAVTGACLMIRRELFLELEGFDESFPVSYNDIDLCLRLIKRGYRIVWTPHAELLHLESASRGSSDWRWSREEADHKRLCARWENEIEHDPFFNPNLDLIGEEKLALACPPRITKPWLR
jgi:O-antigen biosynthesis protein